MTTSFTSVGGVNLPEGLNLTRPLVRLEASADRILLMPRFGLRRLLGSWELPLAEVRMIRPTSGSFRLLPGTDMMSGIEVNMGDGKLWIYWCRDKQGVLGALGALGYPTTKTQMA